MPRMTGKCLSRALRHTYIEKHTLRGNFILNTHNFNGTAVKKEGASHVWLTGLVIFIQRAPVEAPP